MGQSDCEGADDEQSFASYAVLQPYVPTLYLGCRDSELGTASRLGSQRSETCWKSRVDVFIDVCGD